MLDDRTLQRLLRGEVHRMNDALVDQPRYLSELRSMPQPQVPTKSGGMHRFDPEVLERLAVGLTPLVRAFVRLPIRFYVPHDLQGECHIDDAHAIEALEQLGETRRGARDGRLWMSLALAQALAQRWPTVFQFVRQ